MEIHIGLEFVRTHSVILAGFAAPPELNNRNEDGAFGLEMTKKSMNPAQRFALNNEFQAGLWYNGFIVPEMGPEGYLWIWTEGSRGFLIKRSS